MTAEKLQLIRLESMKQYGFGLQAMKTIKVCGACKAAISADQRICSECGHKLPNKTLYQIYKARHRVCPICETIVPDSCEYCPQCGKKLLKHKRNSNI
ncbi:MAG: zinc ribbon domain-containing protein [Clostridia bacterium]|nr:zinc ribbon domain-containing protein [Clostridia bacterium]